MKPQQKLYRVTITDHIGDSQLFTVLALTPNLALQTATLHWAAQYVRNVAITADSKLPDALPIPTPGYITR